MKQISRSVGMAVCLLIAAPLFTSCASQPKVKSQLLADPDVSALNVNVTTFKGQVQLSGYVDNANQRTKAEQIARNIEGVKSVSNDLIVKAQ